MGAAKWIGGIIGFMAGGPLGALAGFVFGSLFDTDSNDAGSYYGEEPTRGTTYTGQRNSFLFSMLVMASYIIRADGRIMHSEMEFVRRFLRSTFGEAAVGEGERILLNLFEQRKQMDRQNPLAFKNTIRDCGTQIAANLTYEERLQLLVFLVEIAKSDGHVCNEEIEALKEVAMYMGLSVKEVESMLNLGGSSLNEAYKVLEIEPTATNELSLRLNSLIFIVFLNDRLAAINMLNMYKKKTVPIRFSGNSSSNYWNSRKKSLFLHFKQEKLWEQLNG